MIIDWQNKAIRSLVPNAQFSVNMQGIHWNTEENGGVACPSEAEIDAEIIVQQAEYDSQAYARNRKAEYDQLNQFEMIFDDDRDGTTTWVDTINEIKGRHPK
jgi:hypothetical protein